MYRYLCNMHVNIVCFYDAISIICYFSVFKIRINVALTTLSVKLYQVKCWEYKPYNEFSKLEFQYGNFKKDAAFRQHYLQLCKYSKFARKKSTIRNWYGNSFEM